MVMQYAIEDEAKTRRELINNIVVMSAALVVIAAVSVGFVAAVENTKNAHATMLLQKLCQDSQLVDDCLQYLSKCKAQDKVDTYLKVTLHKTLEYMKDAMEPTGTNLDSVTPIQRAAVADCKEILLPLAVEELLQLMALQNSTDKSLENNHGDFQTGLSAVIAYQQTCQDGLHAMGIQSAYNENGDSTLTKPMKMAKITLSLIYQQTLDRKTNDKTDKRRSLLGDDYVGNSQRGRHDTENDNTLPPWFSAAERNLLESQGFGGQNPDAIVGKDGKSKYSKIMDAINAYPKDLNRPYVIYVREGKYEERVVISSSCTNISMYGDGLDKTIVSGVVTAKADETTTFKLSTFTVIGNGFFCKDMGFAVPKGYEAGAPLHVHSDKSAFINCKITGKTTGLFAVAHRQFYRNCEFVGDAPVLKGDSAAVIQNSKILLLPPAQKENVVSEQSRTDMRENTGFVIHNCSIDIMNIKQNSNQNSICLGRPQTNNSRTVVMESYLSNAVKPEGWCTGMSGPSPMLLEFNNQGPGAATEKRVSWSRVMGKDEALIYTPAQFIEGDSWLKNPSI